MITRFAPSPTGLLHLGHAYSLARGVAAVAGGGELRLRIDDLDTTRCRPEFVAALEEDLDWLGVSFAGPVLVESQRAAVYEEALERLRGAGLLYPCFCTRKDIEAALAAPHGAAGGRYPGTCRDLPDEPERRATQPHSWRLDHEKALARVGALPSWQDHDGSVHLSTRADLDDAILARKDAPAAYHLACVLDDAAQGVTLVTRSADLAGATPIQRLLQQLLELPEPAYLHHPIVVGADGRRLAKRDRAPTLQQLRADGVEGPALLAALMDERLPLGYRLVDPT
ncbi:tRNA glutamyl-Q(34) synthetase GluQRS [Sphingomicrobium astaxanthinifaciens]|uniref:tRNA glutamyl-Q(34) synthetase GluQRS n=1 Tax=Sphingomicrobium astaxanthinifaciens TaxID=1227949 RepID=UPI001FCCB308|nr:tRNA glutamyl-Q(34) synthetase GluQRS [Sphingomicrobium astaxanthinifaciens]MCJ7421310.1 tRNA glutamyl-Q(34) synthetase GluQRS [Sphingomicrobium astaxanthinifaciens]